jgi:protein-S-isoprenylcysteine O-methyltransferase Ste14
MTDTTHQKFFSRCKRIAVSFLFVVLLGLCLFLPAGTLDWPMAWLLLAIYVVVFVTALLLISDGLCEERSKRHADSKAWDRGLVTLLFLLNFVTFAVAGLDHGSSWTRQLPLVVEIAALSLVICGNVLVVWAMVTNDFFSATIRIQTDRGHAVVSQGPYRFVRHPGYLGIITYVIFQPLMLGSVWALVPAALTVLLTILRTTLEDRALQEELPGYREYAGKVRNRLVPGIW